MDITTLLLRMAVREVMAETGKSQDLMADVLGMSCPDLRCWLNTPANGQHGPWIAHIDRIVDRYLARVYVPRVQKKRGRNIHSGIKTCPRCRVELPRFEFATNGYCKPCNAAKSREGKLRREQLKAVSA